MHCGLKSFKRCISNDTDSSASHFAPYGAAFTAAHGREEPEQNIKWTGPPPSLQDTLPQMQGQFVPARAQGRAAEWSPEKPPARPCWTSVQLAELPPGQLCPACVPEARAQASAITDMLASAVGICWRRSAGQLSR